MGNFIFCTVFWKILQSLHHLLSTFLILNFLSPQLYYESIPSPLFSEFSETLDNTPH